jgi:hypothetical protein
METGLEKPLKAKPLHRQAFSNAIKQWKQQGVLPVLCLDDFESLLKRTEEFDNGFYDNLRSLMNDNALMLVVASRKELSVYGSEYRFVSQFFNLGSVIPLALQIALRLRWLLKTLYNIIQLNFHFLSH